MDELKEESKDDCLYTRLLIDLVKTLKGASEGCSWEVARSRVCRGADEASMRRCLPQTTFRRRLRYYEKNAPKGECVIVIEGKSILRQRYEKKKKPSGNNLLWKNIWNTMRLSGGMERKEAMKQVAKDRGVSKRDIYQALL